MEYMNAIQLIGELNIQSGGGSANLQEKEVTPTTSAIEVLPDLGYDGMSKVTVNAVSSDIDSDIIPTNIKSGVEILGVRGTYEQGYFTSVSGSMLVFGTSDRPASVNESELILQ